ncbi:SUN domain-containing protein 2-like [Colossoma macropomum]|uniref:SUN domain-containing protein 2-like n=1 Tax=Colossoma macropomum TaxID=42526 RepID=UPI00186542B1|nr:SUN domain-containing protein 2-like [Colossoma macropomum]
MDLFVFRRLTEVSAGHHSQNRTTEEALNRPDKISTSAYLCNHDSLSQGEEDPPRKSISRCPPAQMSRRSERLAAGGYYGHSDDAASSSSAESVQVSYKETPVRIFKRRRRRGRRRMGTSCCTSSMIDVLGSGPVLHSLSQKIGDAMHLPSSTVTPLHDLSPPAFTFSRFTSTRKAFLLIILILVLLFGFCYWNLSVSVQLFCHETVRPPLDDRFHYGSLLALKNKIHADLSERQDRWTESRARAMEDMLREIRQLKEDGQKRKLEQEKLQADLRDLRVRLKTVHSEHGSMIKEQLSGVLHQISDLRSDVSDLRSSSELLSDRLEVKLKAELSDWLLQQLSGSVDSEQVVVMHPDLQRALETLEKRIMDRLGEEKEKEKRDMWRTRGETLQEGAGAVTIKDVEQIVHRALSLHRADGVGMADYALESSGASVMKSSETYHTRTAYLSLFGIPLLYHSESPRTVTQPELYPGKCWAFRGSEGFLVISLSYPVQITHVTLEHVPRVLSPTGNISSAPKDFAVYGMTNENAEGEHLGTFTYDQDGEPIQTFKHPDSPSEAYRLVELRILSNWGHPEYTCVYRFRVHGQPWTT